MTAVGFVLGSTVPPVMLPAVARSIEDAGFASIWMSEDYFMTGGVAGAGVVLGATDSIDVGIGLLPVYVRHPALAAMEAGTLAGAHPGRFRLGFGTGVFAWLDQMGTAHRASLATMRQSVRTARMLLAGERVDEDGPFRFRDVRLTFPPAVPPPIYVGATGPRMTELAGEVADGVLMSVKAGPAFVADSRRAVDAAATAAGRPRPTISVFAIFSLADSVAQARREARPVIADYLALGPNELSRSAGIPDDELAALIADGGRDRLRDDMPDAWIDALSVTGDASTCVAAIEALAAAGADEVVLVPVVTDDLPARVAVVGQALRLPRRTRRAPTDSRHQVLQTGPR